MTRKLSKRARRAGPRSVKLRLVSVITLGSVMLYLGVLVLLTSISTSTSPRQVAHLWLNSSPWVPVFILANVLLCAVSSVAALTCGSYGATAPSRSARSTATDKFRSSNEVSLRPISQSELVSGGTKDTPNEPEAQAGD